MLFNAGSAGAESRGPLQALTQEKLILEHCPRKQQSRIRRVLNW